MVEVRFEGEGETLPSPRGEEARMNTAKTLITWFVLCIVCAGGTIVGVQVLDKPLGLRQKIVTFGQPNDTH
jgi:hypothetical protein